MTSTKALLVAAAITLCSAAQAQHTPWKTKAATWACVSEKFVQKQMEAWSAGERDSVRQEFARMVANRRCVSIGAGAVLMNWTGGCFGCCNEALSVLLNQSYYDHYNQRWKFKAYWFTPMRFVWPDNEEARSFKDPCPVS